jgi:hypothetical protein
MGATSVAASLYFFRRAVFINLAEITHIIILTLFPLYIIKLLSEVRVEL